MIAGVLLLGIPVSLVLLLIGWVQRPTTIPFLAITRTRALRACGLALAYTAVDFAWFVGVKHEIYSVVFDACAFVALAVSILLIHSMKNRSGVSRFWLSGWALIGIFAGALYLFGVALPSLLPGEENAVDAISSLFLGLTYIPAGWALSQYRPPVPVVEESGSH